ncbi:hypothetical protein AB0K68_17705 [Streptomyces sp. NPDC050698]
MGIRTFLSRTAPGVALTPVPVSEAAASTVRVPVPFTTALRHTTADLRQRLLAHGRRTTGPSGTVNAGATSPVIATGAVAGTGAGRDTDTAPTPRCGDPRTPDAPGKLCRPWARLARAYLTLALTRLPRPRTRPRSRPAHTTITVYITTADSLLSERPGGSAPSRRPGQSRPGPEPDAAA